MIETWVERALAQVGSAANTARQIVNAAGKREFIRGPNWLAGNRLRCLAPDQRWYLTVVTKVREEKTMGIGTSIFLIALGAILRFAVTASVSGIEIATVGTILMVVGIIGLLISLLYLTIWSDRSRAAAPVDRGAAPAADREVV